MSPQQTIAHYSITGRRRDFSSGGFSIYAPSAGRTVLGFASILFVKLLVELFAAVRRQLIQFGLELGHLALERGLIRPGQ
jgi:hypothetical protein